MWGGKRAIRSKEDLKDIIAIGETLLERSKGFTRTFDKIVRELLIDGTLESNQLRLLNEALGDKSRR